MHSIMCISSVMTLNQRLWQSLGVTFSIYAMFFDMQNGISICLTFLEFFSMSAQRAALSVVASCCHDIVTVDDFRFIRDSLSMLIARLTQQVSHLQLKL